MKVLIRTDGHGPRLNYTFSLIFGGEAGSGFELVSDPGAWSAYPGPRVWYGAGQPPSEACVWLPDSGWLAETGIREFRPETGEFEGKPVLFPAPKSKATLPFDLPAMIFYLVSRYEEYLPFEPDRHGRFPAAQSLGFREGFLDFPLADFWINRLFDLLERRFPGGADPRPAGRPRLTYDIDMPWAFRYRRWWQYPAGYFRDVLRGHLQGLKARLAVHTGKTPDPFFTFPMLARRHRELGLRPTFFFLLAGPGKYDPYPGYRSAAYRTFARELLQHADGGIHPSYRTSDRPDLLSLELQRWQSIFGEPPLRSRQHYLRFRLPDTYRLLLGAGLLEDHSMGFADQPGFRAGTSRPFQWYDLEAEQETRLTVFPFAVMEVTLQQYLGLDPAGAITALRNLHRNATEAGGDWAVLWHNSSFPPAPGWDGWDRVHDEMLNLTANFDK